MNDTVSKDLRMLGTGIAEVMKTVQAVMDSMKTPDTPGMKGQFTRPKFTDIINRRTRLSL